MNGSCQCFILTHSGLFVLLEEDSNVNIFRAQYVYVSLKHRKKNMRVLLLSSVLSLSISEKSSGCILGMASTVADWVSYGHPEVWLSTGRQ